MKNIMAVIALTFSALTAWAQYTGPDVDSAAQATTARQLLASGKDDQYVMLRGRIQKRVDDEQYQFTDGTGDMVAEIERERWPGARAVSEQDTIELMSEYDKEMVGPSKLKVKRVKVIQ
ncbi:hypothetical protein WJ36_09710 [Burkholderia ubonensis]|uniref:NirD/YgiW/YdeI family stress tolerance protein n=1 Tax=Burkholderia ubonensis TaxID=101571 RepID=UPI00075E8DA4|nr:NirD/YgiW/YdeI family stress tolerance protein [Burkholderia ubonensis]KVG83440.1 hypothetical protein WJ36_09710 [Burkholderia ubonensis]